MSFLEIHSLNARDNIFVPWLYGAAGGDPRRFRELMQEQLRDLSALLSTRGVKYSSLKSALVPQSEGRQVVFLYEWFEHPPENYAIAFAREWLPLLRRKMRTTMQSGDLLAERRPDEEFESLVVRSDGLPINWSLQYAVYFSNFQLADIERFHAALKKLPRYRGYIDVTFASSVRDYLARCVTFSRIFSDSRIVVDHGPDEPVIGSEDPTGYPFEEFGYEVVRVIDTHAMTFLDYKIESDWTANSELDAKLSVAAVTGEEIDLDDTEVFVPPDKLDKYLLSAKHPDKRARMTGIGFAQITPEELEEVIRERLAMNYIFNLRMGQDGLTPSFSVPAEFEHQDGTPTRRLIALKWQAVERRISLVTMY